jgi:hypothetical protein
MQQNFEPMRKQVEAWQRNELTEVTAKVVIYEAFVEAKLDARKHLARTVHDLYFEPKYEEFNDLESVQCFYIGIQRAGSDPAVEGDSPGGRIPGRPVLTIVLAGGAVSARPPIPNKYFRLTLDDPCGRGSPAWGEKQYPNPIRR